MPPSFTSQYEWFVKVLREEMKPVLQTVQTLETKVDQIGSEIERTHYSKEAVDSKFREVANDEQNYRKYTHKYIKSIKRELRSLKKRQSTQWERTVTRVGTVIAILLAIIQSIYLIAQFMHH